MMPNLQEEAEMLEWAGVNFGEETTYLLHHSLKRLAIMSGADSVAFCGKVFGTKNDYWVASGKLDKAEEKVDDIKFEQRGTGVNRLVFWVTTNLLSDWIQLPDAHPDHIVAARRFKHVFTGDLNATFNTNPAFPGKERHLLRAQLARIFHATAIAPGGYYTMAEEDEEENKKPDDIPGPKLKIDEEFTWKETAELTNLEEWVNIYPQILKVGRTKHIY